MNNTIGNVNGIHRNESRQDGHGHRTAWQVDRIAQQVYGPAITVHEID